MVEIKLKMDKSGCFEECSVKKMTTTSPLLFNLRKILNYFKS